MSGWHIAQLNVGRILAPTDSPQLAEFMAALDEINARAEAARAMIEPLFDFVYRSAHTTVMARRRQWFDQPRRTRSCGRALRRT